MERTEAVKNLIGPADGPTQRLNSFFIIFKTILREAG